MGVDQGALVLFSDFQHDGEMWTGTGKRQVREPVRFSEPFVSPPVVQVGLSMWDAVHDANTRMDISAENITEEGFEIVFRTWGDSRVARVRADWLAMGEIHDEDDWDLA